jgi:hypothetical protein
MNWGKNQEMVLSTYEKSRPQFYCVRQRSRLCILATLGPLHRFIFDSRDSKSCKAATGTTLMPVYHSHKPVLLGTYMAIASSLLQAIKIFPTLIEIF